MHSLSNFGLIACCCIFTFICLTASIPLDSSPEQSVEDHKRPDFPTQIKLYPIRKGKTTERPKQENCSAKHTVCRLHGPKARKCCGEGQNLFCKIGYGEFYCFERWESAD